MPTHPKCGKTWPGLSTQHCPVCCQTFGGATAGDRHRVGAFADGTRRCRTPDEMLTAGLTPDAQGIWRTDDKGRPTHWRAPARAQGAEQTPTHVLPTPRADEPAESVPDGAA